MPFDEIFKRNTHAFLHCSRVVYMARDVEKFGAGVPFAAKASKPLRPASAYRRGNRHRFHIGNCCGTPKHSWNKADR